MNITQENLNEAMHKVMLMIKTCDVITSIDSILSEYAECNNIRLCQWIDKYIINDTSILQCIKQYVLNNGPGLCEKKMLQQ